MDEKSVEAIYYHGLFYSGEDRVALKNMQQGVIEIRLKLSQSLQLVTN